MVEISEYAGTRVLACAPDGPPLSGEQDAVDLIGAAYHDRADLLAIPVSRLDPAFFTLGSGVAGAVLQKFTQYGFRVAVVGDIDEHLAASTALRDFVREANQGRQVWFVTDEAELAARLGGTDRATGGPDT